MSSLHPQGSLKFVIPILNGNMLLTQKVKVRCRNCLALVKDKLFYFNQTDDSYQFYSEKKDLSDNFAHINFENLMKKFVILKGFSCPNCNTCLGNKQEQKTRILWTFSKDSVYCCSINKRQLQEKQ